MSEGKDLEDQLALLRRKFNLECQSGQAYKDRAESEKKINEEVIVYMRQQNKKLYKQLVAASRQDEETIRTVLKDSKRNWLSLQYASCEEAGETMHGRACDGLKILSSLQHERQKRTKKIKELTEQLEWMESLEKKENVASDRPLTYIENALDKAEIKLHTAKTISKTYAKVVTKLEDEIREMPRKLDLLQEAVVEQNRELNEMKAVAEEAISSRDQVKAELASTEENIKKKERENEIVFNAAKKKFDRRFDEKQTKTLLVPDNFFKRVATDALGKKRNQQKMIEYEEALGVMRAATDVSDVEEMISQIETQQNTIAHLRAQAREREEKRERLKKQLSDLETEYHELKFTRQPYITARQQVLDEIQENTDKERASLEWNVDQLRRNQALMVTIQEAVDNLVDKLDVVKLKSPQHNYTKGDIFAKVDLCREKLKKVLGDLSGRMKFGCGPRLTDKQVQEFITKQLTPENIRVKVQASRTGVLDFAYDGDAHPQYQSREEIKDASQRLVDSKQMTVPK